MKSAVTIVLATALAYGASMSASTAAPTVADRVGVSYTWVGSTGGSGGDGQSWSDPANWEPVGLPGSQDTATIDATGATCQAAVEAVPDGTQVARLSIRQDADCNASVSGGELTVTNSLDWQCGEIATVTTMSAGSHGSLHGTADRDLAGSLVVAGTLTLDQATLTVDQADGLTIVDPGHLQGSGRITGSVVNSGGTVSAGASEDDGPNLSVSGDYTQLAAGTLQFHLPGAFTALSVGGKATVRGRVVYHTTQTYDGPPYGTRQLVIRADDLAWNPWCRTSTGPYRKVGYWLSIRGRGGIPEAWFVKVRFKEGAAHVC